MILMQYPIVVPDSLFSQPSTPPFYLGPHQFGIPPETIKDSMRLGLVVPTVYIVPVERFCREIGPALGANLAEFEFPAYFNFFVLRKRCTLIVDSEDAERSIRSVFGETLLGPEQFRRNDNPMKFENEDFDPSFPDEMKPKFDEEFRHFRIMPDGKELELKTLLKFAHFSGPGASGAHKGLGVLPHHEEKGTNNENGRIHEEGNDELWTYSQTKWIGMSKVFDFTVFLFKLSPFMLIANHINKFINNLIFSCFYRCFDCVP